MSGIGNVVVHVADMDRALRFYQDGLGLDIKFDSGWSSPEPMLALSSTPPGTPMRIVAFELEGTAGLSLCSFQAPGERVAAFEAGGIIHFGLTVDDVDASLTTLEALGGRPLGSPGIVGPPGRQSKLGFIRDPDGAVIELLQHGQVPA